MTKKFIKVIGAILIVSTILGLSMVAVSSSIPQPILTVDVTLHHTSIDSGFDSVLYVSVPHQTPFNGVAFNMLQSFLVEEIDLTTTTPDGTTTHDTFITCTVSASPAYPSRNTMLTCSGFFPWRLNPRVYPGSTTGIYLVGEGGFSATGIWRFTYSVTGLYNGQTVTLTSSFNINVDPPVPAGQPQFS